MLARTMPAPVSRDLRRRHRLHGGVRADRHEGRGRDRPARETQFAAARAGRIFREQSEGVGHAATIAAVGAGQAARTSR